MVHTSAGACADRAVVPLGATFSHRNDVIDTASPCCRRPSAIASVLGFGLDWSPERVALVIAATSLVETVWARGQVTPATAERRA